MALFAGLALALTAALPTASTAQDQWEPGRHMTQAVARVMGSVRGLSEISEYGYADDVCIMAAFVQPDKKVAFERNFRRGEEYLIVGGGDDDVKDLDLEVLDANGRVIDHDEETDATPLLLFTAPQTGRYTIRQHLYDAPVGSFCVVAVMQRGGYDVPITNLVDAAGSLILMANVVDENVTEIVSFQDGDNQWAIFGGIIDEDESLTITNMNPGTGRRVFIAAADTNSSDIDMFVLDEDGDIIDSDEETDATPIVDVRTKSSQSYGMKVTNHTSRGPSLTLMSILQLR